MANLQMNKTKIRALLEKFLNKKHLTIVPLNTVEGKIEKVRYNWLVNLNINTILDVGASTGGFASRIRYHLPKAMIYAFEPIPESYRELTKRFKSDRRFKAFKIAIGDNSENLKFHQNTHVGASSFLEMSALHKDAHPYAKNFSTISVAIDTLDNVVAGEKLQSNILLKMDVQGYEKRVLEGAEQILKKTKVVYSEVSFSHLYDGQPLVNEIVDCLNQHGFRMAGIENVSQSTKDGAFLQADAFFLKNDSKN